MSEWLIVLLIFLGFILFIGGVMPWIIWGFAEGWYDRYLDFVWKHTKGGGDR